MCKGKITMNYLEIICLIKSSSFLKDPWVSSILRTDSDSLMHILTRDDFVMVYLGKSCG